MMSMQSATYHFGFFNRSFVAWTDNVVFTSTKRCSNAVVNAFKVVKQRSYT